MLYFLFVFCVAHKDFFFYIEYLTLKGDRFWWSEWTKFYNFLRWSVWMKIKFLDNEIAKKSDHAAFNNSWSILLGKHLRQYLINPALLYNYYNLYFTPALVLFISFCNYFLGTSCNIIYVLSEINELELGIIKKTSV